MPQLTLLLGLMVGSLDELAKYVGQCWAMLFPRRSTEVAPHRLTRQVHLAALVAVSCTFIVLAMWTADTVFHSLSDSVNTEKYETSPPGEMQTFGYSLTERCQPFNRSENECLPCTLDLSDDMSLLELYTRANEIFRLGTNVSETSQIQRVGPDEVVILPRYSRSRTKQTTERGPLGSRRHVGPSPQRVTCMP